MEPLPLMYFKPIPDDDFTFSESMPRLSRELETSGESIPLLQSRLERLDSVTRDQAISRIESDLAPDEREALGIMVYSDALQGLRDQLNAIQSHITDLQHQLISSKPERREAKHLYEEAESKRRALFEQLINEHTKFYTAYKEPRALIPGLIEELKGFRRQLYVESSFEAKDRWMSTMTP